MRASPTLCSALFQTVERLEERDDGEAIGRERQSAAILPQFTRHDRRHFLWLTGTHLIVSEEQILGLLVESKQAAMAHETYRDVTRNSCGVSDRSAVVSTDACFCKMSSRRWLAARARLSVSSSLTSSEFAKMPKGSISVPRTAQSSSTDISRKARRRSIWHAP